MKIAFLQNITDTLLGYMYMSACLTQAGHECEVFVSGFEKDILRSLEKFQPDIIGIYCVTGNVDWAIPLVQEFKQQNPNCLLILGGPHPTFHPDTIHLEGVDAICVGEGEEAIVKIAERYDKKTLASIADIENIWIKENGQVKENKLRPLVGDLDSLPFPDRSLYEKYPYYTKLETLPIIATRGCPFDCAYCYNHVARKLYRGLGKFVRYRSPDKVIAEIRDIKKNHNRLKFVVFQDSTLNLHHEWFMELMEKYAEAPFFCHIRPDITNDEQIDALKRAGCRSVAFGIEGGSYRLRKEILGRDITDEEIIEVATKIKKAGLISSTANIFGLPTETIGETYGLIRINQQIQPDVVAATVFQPYPGTRLGKFALEHRLVDKIDYETINNYYHRSILKQKDIDLQERLQKLMLYYVKFPYLTKLWDFLAQYAPFTLLTYLFYAATVFNVKKVYGYSWFSILKYGFLNLAYYSRQ